MIYHRVRIAHSAGAEAVGLSGLAIRATVAGGRPDFDSEAEASAYDCTWQLCRTHQVDDEISMRAADASGEAGVVDIVMLIGLT